MSQQWHVGNARSSVRQPLALSCAARPLPLPSQVGTLYSMHDGRKTLQNVFALDLFDNVQVG